MVGGKEALVKFCDLMVDLPRENLFLLGQIFQLGESFREFCCDFFKFHEKI